jgi:hypothetical protein
MQLMVMMLERKSIVSIIPQRKSMYRDETPGLGHHNHKDKIKPRSPLLKRDWRLRLGVKTDTGHASPCR